MCTAITYQTRDFYFGRTLDMEYSYSEEVTVMPRAYPLTFRRRETIAEHYGMIGMAHVIRNYPLYYDAVNEKGLAMAGLNFAGNAVYGAILPGKENITHFELIPWILGTCASVKEAKQRLEKTNLTDDGFCEDFPAAQLHWLLADRDQAVTLERVASGLRIYENPMGVLTNNPPFDRQLENLRRYTHLSSREPSGIGTVQSRGMGALGLPGDLTSSSRFVRAVFVKENAVSGFAEQESVGQFFHILGAVEQVKGCCRLEDGSYEKTVYTACCNADKGIYYYTTYENRGITAVDLFRENLEGNYLKRYPLTKIQQIQYAN
ncbi:MAG: choloylglycine hydrolase [Oscillospiraceae bacterium]|nr:choloylglycine hydrolase [Oscillospiraceae bacterium]